MDFDSPSTPNICALIRGKVPTTSMSYHEDGVHLFVASEADSRLRLMDTVRGTSDVIPLKLEREGIQLVRATHHNQCVLYTTSPLRNYNGTNSIQYLSLYDNKVLRQFSPSAAAAVGRVQTLSMSPVDDLFLSASTDRIIRLYDIATPKCIAEMTLPSQGMSTQHGLTTLDTTSPPCAAFDSSGLVFAASTRVSSPSDHLIHLYDARKYDAPFSEFRISVSAVANALHSHYQATRSLSTSTSFYPLSLQKAMEMASLAQWTNMTFSPSGKGILVTMENGLVLVLDSFEGNILHVFMSEGGSSSTDISLPTYPAAACYTSDDQSILCGNENGTLSCWDVTTGRLRRKLEGHTGSRVFCIQSNPKFAQFASACTNVALWLW